MMTTLSNDGLTLTPRTTFDSPAFSFDFPGLRIGVAEYDEGPTGCTVFLFPHGGVTQAIDIRGGAPGVTGDYAAVDAICLAGGSLYGLEATSGVVAELFAERNFSVAWEDMATVSGAIIFDYGARANRIYPDKALGRAAVRSAREGVFLPGRRGAGRSATVGAGLHQDGSEHGGQGCAFRQIGELRLAVFNVVNALGMIHNRQGQIVRGGLHKKTGTRHSFAEQLEQQLRSGGPTDVRAGNTTLTVLVTNARLAENDLKQLGRSVHSSLGRAIQPFHTADDGDVLFTTTTNQVDAGLSLAALSVIAADLAWDAVLRAVDAEDVR